MATLTLLAAQNRKKAKDLARRATIARSPKAAGSNTAKELDASTTHDRQRRRRTSGAIDAGHSGTTGEETRSWFSITMCPYVAWPTHYVSSGSYLFPGTPIRKTDSIYPGSGIKHRESCLSSRIGLQPGLVIDRFEVERTTERDRPWAGERDTLRTGIDNVRFQQFVGAGRDGGLVCQIWASGTYLLVVDRSFPVDTDSGFDRLDRFQL